MIKRRQALFTLIIIFCSTINLFAPYVSGPQRHLDNSTQSQQPPWSTFTTSLITPDPQKAGRAYTIFSGGAQQNLQQAAQTSKKQQEQQQREANRIAHAQRAQEADARNRQKLLEEKQQRLAAQRQLAEKQRQHEEEKRRLAQQLAEEQRRLEQEKRLAEERKLEEQRRLAEIEKKRIAQEKQRLIAKKQAEFDQKFTELNQQLQNQKSSLIKQTESLQQYTLAQVTKSQAPQKPGLTLAELEAAQTSNLETFKKEANAQLDSWNRQFNACSNTLKQLNDFISQSGTLATPAMVQLTVKEQNMLTEQQKITNQLLEKLKLLHNQQNFNLAALNTFIATHQQQLAIYESSQTTFNTLYQQFTGQPLPSLPSVDPVDFDKQPLLTLNQIIIDLEDQSENLEKMLKDLEAAQEALNECITQAQALQKLFNNTPAYSQTAEGLAAAQRAAELSDKQEDIAKHRNDIKEAVQQRNAQLDKASPILDRKKTALEKSRLALITKIETINQSSNAVSKEITDTNWKTSTIEITEQTLSSAFDDPIKKVSKQLEDAEQLLKTLGSLNEETTEALANLYDLEKELGWIFDDNSIKELQNTIDEKKIALGTIISNLTDKLTSLKANQTETLQKEFATINASIINATSTTGEEKNDSTQRTIAAQCLNLAEQTKIIKAQSDRMKKEKYSNEESEKLNQIIKQNTASRDKNITRINQRLDNYNQRFDKITQKRRNSIKKLSELSADEINKESTRIEEQVTKDLNQNVAKIVGNDLEINEALERLKAFTELKTTQANLEILQKSITNHKQLLNELNTAKETALEEAKKRKEAEEKERKRLEEEKKKKEELTQIFNKLLEELSELIEQTTAEQNKFNALDAPALSENPTLQNLIAQADATIAGLKGKIAAANKYNQLVGGIKEKQNEGLEILKQINKLSPKENQTEASAQLKQEFSKANTQIEEFKTQLQEAQNKKDSLELVQKSFKDPYKKIQEQHDEVKNTLTRINSKIAHEKAALDLIKPEALLTIQDIQQHLETLKECEQTIKDLNPSIQEYTSNRNTLSQEITQLKEVFGSVSDCSEKTQISALFDQIAKLPETFNTQDLATKIANLKQALENRKAELEDANNAAYAKLSEQLETIKKALNATENQIENYQKDKQILLDEYNNIQADNKTLSALRKDAQKIVNNLSPRKRIKPAPLQQSLEEINNNLEKVKQLITDFEASDAFKTPLSSEHTAEIKQSLQQQQNKLQELQNQYKSIKKDNQKQSVAIQQNIKIQRKISGKYKELQSQFPATDLNLPLPEVPAITDKPDLKESSLEVLNGLLTQAQATLKTSKEEQNKLATIKQNLVNAQKANQEIKELLKDWKQISEYKTALVKDKELAEMLKKCEEQDKALANALAQQTEVIKQIEEQIQAQKQNEAEQKARLEENQTKFEELKNSFIAYINNGTSNQNSPTALNKFAASLKDPADDNINAELKAEITKFNTDVRTFNTQAQAATPFRRELNEIIVAIADGEKKNEGFLAKYKAINLPAESEPRATLSQDIDWLSRTSRGLAEKIIPANGYNDNRNLLNQLLAKANVQIESITGELGEINIAPIMLIERDKDIPENTKALFEESSKHGSSKTRVEEIQKQYTLATNRTDDDIQKINNLNGPLTEQLNAHKTNIEQLTANLSEKTLPELNEIQQKLDQINIESIDDLQEQLQTLSKDKRDLEALEEPLANYQEAPRVKQLLASLQASSGQTDATIKLHREVSASLQQAKEQIRKSKEAIEKQNEIEKNKLAETIKALTDKYNPLFQNVHEVGKKLDSLTISVEESAATVPTLEAQKNALDKLNQQLATIKDNIANNDKEAKEQFADLPDEVDNEQITQLKKQILETQQKIGKQKTLAEELADQIKQKIAAVEKAISKNNDDATELKASFDKALGEANKTLEEAKEARNKFYAKQKEKQQLFDELNKEYQDQDTKSLGTMASNATQYARALESQNTLHKNWQTQINKLKENIEQAEESLGKWKTLLGDEPTEDYKTGATDLQTVKDQLQAQDNILTTIKDNTEAEINKALEDAQQLNVLKEQSNKQEEIYAATSAYKVDIPTKKSENVNRWLEMLTDIQKNLNENVNILEKKSEAAIDWQAIFLNNNLGSKSTEAYRAQRAIKDTTDATTKNKTQLEAIKPLLEAATKDFERLTQELENTQQGYERALQTFKTTAEAYKQKPGDEPEKLNIGSIKDLKENKTEFENHKETLAQQQKKLEKLKEEKDLVITIGNQLITIQEQLSGDQTLPEELAKVRDYEIPANADNNTKIEQVATTIEQLNKMIQDREEAQESLKQQTEKLIEQTTRLQDKLPAIATGTAKDLAEQDSINSILKEITQFIETTENQDDTPDNIFGEKLQGYKEAKEAAEQATAKANQLNDLYQEIEPLLEQIQKLQPLLDAARNNYDTIEIPREPANSDDQPLQKIIDGLVAQNNIALEKKNATQDYNQQQRQLAGIINQASIIRDEIKTQLASAEDLFPELAEVPTPLDADTKTGNIIARAPALIAALEAAQTTYNDSYKKLTAQQTELKEQITRIKQTITEIEKSPETLNKDIYDDLKIQQVELLVKQEELNSTIADLAQIFSTDNIPSCIEKANVLKLRDEFNSLEIPKLDEVMNIIEANKKTAQENYDQARDAFEAAQTEYQELLEDPAPDQKPEGTIKQLTAQKEALETLKNNNARELTQRLTELKTLLDAVTEAKESLKEASALSAETGNEEWDFGKVEEQLQSEALDLTLPDDAAIKTKIDAIQQNIDKLKAQIQARQKAQEELKEKLELLDNQVTTLNDQRAGIANGKENSLETAPQSITKIEAASEEIQSLINKKVAELEDSNSNIFGQELIEKVTEAQKRKEEVLESVKLIIDIRKEFDEFLKDKLNPEIETLKKLYAATQPGQHNHPPQTIIEGQTIKQPESLSDKIARIELNKTESQTKKNNQEAFNTQLVNVDELVKEANKILQNMPAELKSSYNPSLGDAANAIDVSVQEKRIAEYDNNITKLRAAAEVYQQKDVFIEEQKTLINKQQAIQESIEKAQTTLDSIILGATAAELDADLEKVNTIGITAIQTAITEFEAKKQEFTDKVAKLIDLFENVNCTEKTELAKLQATVSALTTPTIDGLKEAIQNKKQEIIRAKEERIKAEEETKRKTAEAEEEARKLREQEERQRKEAEETKRLEDEKRREEERQQEEAAETKRKQKEAEEERLKADEERKRKEQEESKRKQEEERKLKEQEEAERKQKEKEQQEAVEKQQREEAFKNQITEFEQLVTTQKQLLPKIVNQESPLAANTIIQKINSALNPLKQQDTTEIDGTLTNRKDKAIKHGEKIIEAATVLGKLAQTIQTLSKILNEEGKIFDSELESNFAIMRPSAQDKVTQSDTTIENLLLQIEAGNKFNETLKQIGQAWTDVENELDSINQNLPVNLKIQIPNKNLPEAKEIQSLQDKLEKEESNKNALKDINRKLTNLTQQLSAIPTDQQLPKVPAIISLQTDDKTSLEKINQKKQSATENLSLMDTGITQLQTIQTNLQQAQEVNDQIIKLLEPDHKDTQNYNKAQEKQREITTKIEAVKANIATLTTAKKEQEEEIKWIQKEFQDATLNALLEEINQRRLATSASLEAYNSAVSKAKKEADDTNGKSLEQIIKDIQAHKQAIQNPEIIAPYFEARKAFENKVAAAENMLKTTQQSPTKPAEYDGAIRMPRENLWPTPASINTTAQNLDKKIEELEKLISNYTTQKQAFLDAKITAEQALNEMSLQQTDNNQAPIETTTLASIDLQPLTAQANALKDLLNNYANSEEGQQATNLVQAVQQLIQRKKKLIEDAQLKLKQAQKAEADRKEQERKKQEEAKRIEEERKRVEEERRLQEERKKKEEELKRLEDEKRQREEEEKRKQKEKEDKDRLRKEQEEKEQKRQEEAAVTERKRKEEENRIKAEEELKRQQLAEELKRKEQEEERKKQEELPATNVIEKLKKLLKNPPTIEQEIEQWEKNIEENAIELQKIIQDTNQHYHARKAAIDYINSIMRSITTIEKIKDTFLKYIPSRTSNKWAGIIEKIPEEVTELLSKTTDSEEARKTNLKTALEQLETYKKDKSKSFVNNYNQKSILKIHGLMLVLKSCNIPLNNNQNNQPNAIIGSLQNPFSIINNKIMQIQNDLQPKPTIAQTPILDKIEAYKNLLNDLRSIEGKISEEIQEAELAIANITDDISDISNKTIALEKQTEIANLEKNINQLQTKYKNLKEKYRTQTKILSERYNIVGITKPNLTLWDYETDRLDEHTRKMNQYFTQLPQNSEERKLYMEIQRIGNSIINDTQGKALDNLSNSASTLNRQIQSLLSTLPDEKEKKLLKQEHPQIENVPNPDTQIIENQTDIQEPFQIENQSSTDFQAIQDEQPRGSKRKRVDEEDTPQTLGGETSDQPQEKRQKLEEPQSEMIQQDDLQLITETTVAPSQPEEQDYPRQAALTNPQENITSETSSDVGQPALYTVQGTRYSPLRIIPLEPQSTLVAQTEPPATLPDEPVKKKA